MDSPRRTFDRHAAAAAARRLHARHNPTADADDLSSPFSALNAAGAALSTCRGRDVVNPHTSREDVLDALAQIPAACELIDYSELQMITEARERFDVDWATIAEQLGYTTEQDAQARYQTLTDQYHHWAKFYETHALDAKRHDIRDGRADRM